MHEPIEDRLAQLASTAAPDAPPPPQAFIAAVARTRRRRKTVANVAAWMIAAAPIAVWMWSASAPLNSPPRVADNSTNAPRAGDSPNATGDSGASSRWTLAALSRRIDQLDLSADLDADALIPGRWSMGWTTRKLR